MRIGPQEKPKLDKKYLFDLRRGLAQFVRPFAREDWDKIPEGTPVIVRTKPYEDYVIGRIGGCDDLYVLVYTDDQHTHSILADNVGSITQIPPEFA